MKSIFYLSVFALIFTLSIFAIPDAHAAPMTFAVDTTITTSQTIANGETWTINSGVELSIDPGVTITVDNGGAINNSGTITLFNNGTIISVATLNNSGTITLSNTGTGNGISNYGAINNSGTITISNTDTTGILSYGDINNSGTITISNTSTINGTSIGILNKAGNTITNSGTITISNSGSSSIGITNGDTIINNSGTITISNSGGRGINNFGTITNSGGLITVSNTAGIGIFITIGDLITNNSGGIITISNTSIGTGITNNGTITNSGTITISNTSIGTGIFNSFSATITNNSGTITVSNTSGIGIENNGTITNSGTMTISNTSDNGIFNGGTITNSGGLITVSNSGGTGIGNVATITNSGTITVSNTSDNGIFNIGTITNNSGGTITVSNTSGTGITSTGTITNNGAINNSGTITVSNTSGTGITNNGTITNSGGIITISNTSTGIGINNFATITNSGTITISNTGSEGIYNSGGTLDNSGTITISNTDGKGILSYGAITNSGTITISNTSSTSNGTSTGIKIKSGNTITNSGTMTISNSGPSFGIDNSGTFTNSGTITVSTTVDGTGIYNTGGTLNNSGTITLSNTGASIGIFNGGTLITNSGGLITVSNTGGTGIYNKSGNTITNNSGGLITVSNTDNTGIYNQSGATITNSGTITISNSGPSFGITNSGTIINNSEIHICGGTYSGIPPSGNPIQNICDTDGDGILNSIDTQPNVFSNDFSDGVTSGTILIRGNQTLTISDEPDPAGVRIIAAASGGLIPANLSFCAGSVLAIISAGDNIVKTNCIPDPIQVFNGPIELTFTGNDGSTATTSLGTGYTLSFDPSTFTFSTPPTNPDTIIINTGGNNIPLNPGTTIQEITVNIDIKPGDGANPINIKKDTIVPVGLFGSSTFDVNNVDLKSIRFGGQTPQTPAKSSIQKINTDTYKDIMSQFKVSGLGFKLGDTKGCLTGKTLDGIPFRGCDFVKIQNPPKSNLELVYDNGVTATVFGTVFTDTDGDGTQGVDESGIKGRTVILVDGAGTRLEDQTTDANGIYSFTVSSPGTILVQAAPVPANHLPSTGFNSYSSLATTVNSTTIVDFPMTPIIPSNMATVTGTIFEDTNNNGVQDLGESGLAGVQVFVVDFLTLTQTTVTTNVNGVYTATGILPDVVLIQAAPIPAGHLPHTTTYSYQTLAQGSTTTVNFALKPVTLPDKGTIIIDVFNDTNSNGIKDAGETGVQNAVVFTFELLTAQANVQVTGSSGITTHSGLIPDIVLAQINAAILPAGFSTITTANGGFEFVPVTPGSTTIVKIGLH